MKRLMLAIGLAGAVGLAGAESAVAHKLTVTSPGQDAPVIDRQNLAVGTPRFFDADGNYVGDGGVTSAASHGTNTACEAVHGTGGVVDIDGGTCTAP